MQGWSVILTNFPEEASPNLVIILLFGVLRLSRSVYQMSRFFFNKRAEDHMAKAQILILSKERFSQVISGINPFR